MSGPTGCIDVVAAVIQRGDSYLLCQRAAGGAHGGLWEFPGGKIESGESQVQALARELEEELGLVAVQIHEHLTSFVDKRSGFHLHFFRVRSEQQPQVLEHRALRWCPPNEIETLPMAPADRHCAQRLDLSAQRDNPPVAQAGVRS